MATIEFSPAYSGFDVVLAIAICLPLAWSVAEKARALGRSFNAFFFGSLIATPIAGWLAMFRVRRQAGDPIRIPPVFWIYVAAIASPFIVGAFAPHSFNIRLTIPSAVLNVSLLVALAAGSRLAWWIELFIGVMSALLVAGLGTDDPWIAATVACELFGVLVLLAPGMRRRLPVRLTFGPPPDTA